MIRAVPFARLRGLLIVALAALSVTALPMPRASATTYNPVFDCESSPTTVTAGGAVTINGSLAFGVTPVAYAPVEVDYSLDSGAHWTRYALGTTDGSGHVQWTDVHPSVTADWSCYYNGDTVTTPHGTDTYTPATSPSITITVTPAPAVAVTHMTKAASPSTITAGQVTTITVTLLSGTAPVVGRTVYLNYYRSDSGSWQRLCTKTTDSTGSAACPDSPPSSTTYAWGFDGDSTYGSSVSGNFDVTVNPATTSPPPTVTPTHLTVMAPAGPVSSGTATTITGYLQTTAGAPVVARTVGLLANGDHIGDAVSDSAGFLHFVAYPTATTQYEWQFGGDATYGASQSIPVATVSVTASNPGIATLVSHVSRHKITRRHRLRIWGTYSQPFDGAVVVLYRQTSTGRVRVASTAMDSAGYYVFRLHPRTLGTIHYIAEVVQGGQAADAPALTVHVHRAQ